MPYWLRNILRIAGVIGGLLAIFLFLNQVVSYAKSSVQKAQTATVSSFVTTSYISDQPFGNDTQEVVPGKLYFYNMKVAKQDGVVCYINVSWRWVLRLPTGSIVYWTDQRGGESATTPEHVMDIAQAFEVPASLIPGKYTLSRLATYKCGDDNDYAKVVRTTDLIVKEAQ